MECQQQLQIPPRVTVLHASSWNWTVPFTLERKQSKRVKECHCFARCRSKAWGNVPVVLGDHSRCFPILKVIQISEAGMHALIPGKLLKGMTAISVSPVSTIPSLATDEFGHECRVLMAALLHWRTASNMTDLIAYGDLHILFIRVRFFVYLFWYYREMLPCCCQR